MDEWGFRSSQYSPPVVSGRDGKLSTLKWPQGVRTTVHIDSRDRDYTTHPSSSQFTVDLPESLKNVSAAVLVSAELPLTYYVFSAARGNTSLTLTHAGVTQTVTIPDGNYTTATMATALKAALEAAFAAVTFTVTFSASTAKCTIAGAGGAAIAIDTTAAPAAKQTDWGLAYYLGFPKGAATSGTGSVTGTRVAVLSPENYVLIDIEELNGLGQGAIYAAGGSGLRTFAKVPLQGDHYTFNYYDKTPTYVDVRPQLTKLDKLRVAIRFHDGTLVDLNGAEWSMSIEFACTLTRTL